MSRKFEPSHEEIERRAYEIFVERGYQDGGDTEDWFAAEEQLRAVAYEEGIRLETEPVEQAPGADAERFSVSLRKKSAAAGFPTGSSS